MRGLFQQPIYQVIGQFIRPVNLVIVCKPNGLGFAFGNEFPFSLCLLWLRFRRWWCGSLCHGLD